MNNSLLYDDPDFQDLRAYLNTPGSSHYSIVYHPYKLRSLQGRQMKNYNNINIIMIGAGIATILFAIYQKIWSI